jgi:hypothetical protein
MITDISTLFKTGGTHLYTLMIHVDGHFVMFLCRNSYIPRNTYKQGGHDPKSILPDAPGYALIPQDTQSESLPDYEKI